MPTCHNTIKFETHLLGRSERVCGKALHAHDHGVQPRQLTDGTRVNVHIPQNGPWWFCLSCDTNQGMGCASCVFAQNRGTP